MTAKRNTPTGLRVRHQRHCLRETGGDPCRCSPNPSYEAWIFERRTGRKISRCFSGKGAFAAAKAWRADATHALARGRLRPQSRQTVRQAAEALIAGMRDGSIRSARRRPYKPSVIRGYERALGVTPEQRQRAPERVLERLGDFKLGELDRHIVQDYAERLLSDGWDPSTVANQIDVLRVIYRRARDRDEVAVDPTERLDLPTPEGKRERIASPAEAAALLDALPQDDRALWGTAFYAGLRGGELRAMRWGDVELAARELRVERSWDDVEGEQRDGKTAAAQRVVPIIGALAPLLRDHQMRTGRRGADLVFGRSADAPFCPSTVRRSALDAWEAAALQPIGFHEGRHTFASLMIAAGVDAKSISTYMGHSSIVITFGTYGHLIEGARDEAVRRVDRLLAAPAPETRLREV